MHSFHHRAYHALFAVLLIGLAHAQTFVSPAHRLIRYTGRFDFSRPAYARFDWPGAQIQAAFNGTSCSMRMKGNNDAFSIIIDDSIETTVTLKSGTLVYPLAENLADTIHSLRIVKRFERWHCAEFKGFILEHGKKLVAPGSRPRYRIELIGGSLVTGFGVESKSVECAGDIAHYSNAWYGFGPVAARVLDAEYSIVAISGKGLVREWASPFLASPMPFGTYYTRTLKNRKHPRHRADTWQAHAAVICIGTNDYSTTPFAPEEVFRARYRALIHSVQHTYPGAEIICVTGIKEPLKTLVKKVVDTENDSGNTRTHFYCYGKIPHTERGCGWHPNIKGHERIAKGLTEVLKPLLPE